LSGAEVPTGSAGGDTACAQSLVRSVAEPEGGAGDELDHAVDALAFGVAVSGVDERVERRRGDRPPALSPNR
jgi:hypothetical protein